jgi:hypothetical protein
MRPIAVAVIVFAAMLVFSGMFETVLVLPAVALALLDLDDELV